MAAVQPVLAATFFDALHYGCITRAGGDDGCAGVQLIGERVPGLARSTNALKDGGDGAVAVNASEPDISNNVGPVKLFLKTLLSFHLKEFFSFVFFLLLSFSFFSASTTTARL